MRQKRKIRIAEGSGNVFADVGLENPEEELIRAELVLPLVRAIRTLGITQAEAANPLGVDAAKISALVNGKLDDRTVRFPENLDDIRRQRDVELRDRVGNVRFVR